jgi:hypothetical protein
MAKKTAPAPRRESCHASLRVTFRTGQTPHLEIRGIEDRNMKYFWVIVLAALAGFSGRVWAQAQPAQSASAPRSQVAGLVATIEAPDNRITVKTDKGDTVTITTSARTLILEMPPGETDVQKAVKMTISELSVGDRVVAIFRGAADLKTVEATSLVVRTKSDLDKISKTEQEDWQRRGTTGQVVSLDPAAKTIALKAGQRSVTVQASDQTDYHRYSPDSARFSDAKPSSFAEIKVGDQVRVLGNRSADGTVKAERIAAGTFPQIAATIVSIDTAAGEMRVTDLATKKPLIIRVNSDSTMRKLDPTVAAMLARRYRPGGQGQAEGASDSPEGRGGQRGGGTGGMSRGGGRGAGDIGQMLDRLPPLQLSELKRGDAIMVCTTMGTDPGRVTAITLLAGVEPLLTASPSSTRDIMSGWNLGGGGGGGEGNQ